MGARIEDSEGYVICFASSVTHRRVYPSSRAGVPAGRGQMTGTEAGPTDKYFAYGGPTNQNACGIYETIY